MESEYQVLNAIEKNMKATQREIAKSTGLSLGSVNVLIKRLIKKGFLKVEKLSPRTIRYVLTPQGFKENAEKAYRFAVASYRQINAVNGRMDKIAQSLSGGDAKTVCAFGEDDEICEMLVGRLKRHKVKFARARTGGEAEGLIEKAAAAGAGQPVFIVWRHEYAQMLADKDIKCYNLLEGL